ncbi:MAG: helix-turn-helix domain-containing protein [Candidatus Anammoximicrobium sp.]|nr:helix-turn-helix domain-containing protein [Candidatus Anammoximicrobium sp.]
MSRDREYLSAADVAERLGFASAESIYSLIRSGELAAIDTGAGRRVKPRWVIRASDLERFLLSRSTRPAAPATPTRRPRRPERVIEFY